MYLLAVAWKRGETITDSRLTCVTCGQEQAPIALAARTAATKRYSVKLVNHAQAIKHALFITVYYLITPAVPTCTSRVYASLGDTEYADIQLNCCTAVRVLQYN
jgi:hypothetical protein